MFGQDPTWEHTLQRTKIGIFLKKYTQRQKRITHLPPFSQSLPQIALRGMRVGLCCTPSGPRNEQANPPRNSDRNRPKTTLSPQQKQRRSAPLSRVHSAIRFALVEHSAPLLEGYLIDIPVAVVACGVINIHRCGILLSPIEVSVCIGVIAENAEVTTRVSNSILGCVAI